MRWISFSMLLLTALACDDAAMSDDPDATVVDAAVDAAPTTGPWRCLGAVEPIEFDDTVATGTIVVAGFPSGAPLGDVTVRVCAVGDDDCAEPITEAVTDADGRALMEVPRDGPIYYEISGAAVVSSIFYRRAEPPVDGFETSLGALTPIVWDTFLGLLDAQADPDRGHLVITTRDCDAALAAGVSVGADTADADSTIAYLAGGIPVLDAEGTDGDGRAGVVNLPAGEAEVTTAVQADGRRVATRRVHIRAGWIAFIGAIPTP